MKETNLLLSLFILMGVIVLSACDVKPTSVTNIPAVATSVAATNVVVVETEAYPAETQILPTAAETLAITTPVTSTLPQTDDEWLAFITDKLAGHHSLDFLLRQNLSEQQWLDVLAERMHSDVVLTDEEKSAMIEWLMAH